MPFEQAGGRMLITGGAGFIGVNAADHFARRGWMVTLFDDLSRPGTERNLAWLRGTHPRSVRFIKGDVGDIEALGEAVAGQDAILHLAAQVAVTTSLTDPRRDFDINASGTLHVLETVRHRAPAATLVFASTNKVYGELVDWALRPTASRFVPTDGRSGVDERQPLDFHSPYGCSKGAADQYVRDYARCFGLRTVVFRQSCVYGAHQFGNEDQGWVAHFVHAVVSGRPLTIYGDGRQVRDLLDVRDVCDLYERTIQAPDRVAGQAINIGGGPANARSVIEVLAEIEAAVGTDATYTFAGWRTGDQRYYVSDVALAKRLLGWQPSIDFSAGLKDLVAWAHAQRAA